VSYIEAGGRTGHPWQSDHPGTEVGGLTGPGGGQTTRGSLRRPRTTSVERDTLSIFLGFQ
jgi:hypothetical protein